MWYLGIVGIACTVVQHTALWPQVVVLHIMFEISCCRSMVVCRQCWGVGIVWWASFMFTVCTWQVATVAPRLLFCSYVGHCYSPHWSFGAKWSASPQSAPPITPSLQRSGSPTFIFFNYKLSHGFEKQWIGSLKKIPLSTLKHVSAILMLWEFFILGDAVENLKVVFSVHAFLHGCGLVVLLLPLYILLSISLCLSLPSPLRFYHVQILTSFLRWVLLYRGIHVFPKTFW